MTSSNFGWDSLLQSHAPPNCSLKAALFTSYDRPDERFLAEHLLPALLDLNREPVSEGSQRKFFLLKLDQHLKRLHENIVVVSSTAREEAADSDDARSPYGWIWRSMRHLMVGRSGHAVQHAKLWLLHWEASDDDPDEKDRAEFLEVVVSSANLTRAAFKNQIQAAWRTLVKLEPRTSQQRRNSWGVLPDFLRELAKSAGNKSRLDPFIELLARADCPADTTFVASVPGTHSRQTLRQTPWGIAGLSHIAPPGRGQVSVAILSPFVGSWSEETLRHWCAEFEGTPTGLKLVWVDKSHPWAEKWLLPASALQSLKEEGSTLLQLPVETDDSTELASCFHDEHKPQDPRWSHAKVYFFKRGNSRRMLVSSANFSPAAWGRKNANGELFIENFELGVCIGQANWRFEQLDEFDDWESVTTASEAPTREAALITWAQAEWDGTKVIIDCRCEAGANLTATVCGNRPCDITRWTKTDSDCLHACVPWDDPEDIPSWIVLACENQKVRVSVFDARSVQERADTAPPEVDPSEVEAMRDAILFEQYGGRVAGDEHDVSRNDKATSTDNLEDGGRGMVDSYDVPAFVQARWHFDIVDNWLCQWERAKQRTAWESDLQGIHDDGQRLSEAFKRQQKRDEKLSPANAIGAKLAAEELTIRLKHFSEA